MQRTSSGILKPGVGKVVEVGSPRLSFADFSGHALENVAEIPSRQSGRYSSSHRGADEEDPCAECADIRCSPLRWLLLPLIALVVFAFIYYLTPDPKRPIEPKPDGSLSSAEWADEEPVAAEWGSGAADLAG